MAELEAAAKRLDQSEGGKSALVDQVSMRIVPLNIEHFQCFFIGPHFGAKVSEIILL